MPIDPRMVKWDDAPDGKPDPRMVKWDDKPKAHANDIGGMVMGALDGLQHHIVNAPLGIAQLAGHGVASAVEGFAPDYAARLRAQDQGLQQREQNYQARTDGNAGSYVGATIGEVAPWMTGMGELRAAGMLPKAATLGGKIGLLAGEGAAMGAATPVTQDGSYAAHKAQQIGVGAVAAPALAGATNGLLGAGRVGADVFNRLFRPEAAADNAIGRAVDPAMLPQLEQASSVPGVMPTVAEAAPSPKAIKLERKLRNDPIRGLPFATQDNANNAARYDVISGLAGTPEAMAAAKAARTAATDPYYAQLPGKTVDPTSVMQAIDALHNSSLGVRPNIKNAAASLKAEITARTGPDGMIGADILSGLHENAGSHLGPMASAQEKKALVPLKSSIADALDAAVPGYRDNLAAYASHSQPIGDMQTARALRDAIDSGGRDSGGNQVATLNVLNKALRGDSKARFPMSTQMRTQIESLRDSLQARSALNNSLGASGSNTLADTLLAGKHMGYVKGGASMAVGGLLGHLGMPGMGEAIGGGAGLAATGLLGHANDKVGLLVAERMANAQKAAAIVKALQAKKSGLLGRATSIPQYLLPYAQ